MRTKFILHGGFAKGIKQQNDLFFQEMLKDSANEINVLLVYFAEPEEKVQLRTDQDKEEFSANQDSKILHFKVASEETFENDCTWADLIYLHGGKTIKLLESLIKYPDIVQMFSGKTIAGDSAGIHALGKKYYSKNSGEIRDGLGILPLKIMAHYEDSMMNPFASIESELETLLLREYEMKVLFEDLV